jgi:hypothetical protein
MASFTAFGIGGFDASTTSLTNSTLAGSIPAGKKGLVSFWVKMLGGAGTDRYVFNITTTTAIRLWCYVTTANVVTILGRKADATNVLAMSSALGSTPFTPPPTGWIHVAMWWDLSLASPTNSGQIYVNGVFNMSGTKTFTNDDIAYNMNTMHVGVNPSAGLKFFGSMSELYVNLHETLDLSVPANLAKFISGGLPVSLGATGTLPTGSQPEFYLGDDNNNTNWQTNNGSKGNFTVTGTLTSVTGPP